MNSIKKIDPLAYEHLMERDPKFWCKAFFEVDRACDAYVNGISKSFNYVIDLARKRSLITMLEEIRIYAMERMYKMLLEGQSWGNLKICPSIRLKISKLKKQQRFWGVIPYRIQQYEVRIGNDGYVVDLNNNTCGCRSWQVSGIPCVHAVAVISYLNRNARDYITPWFHTTMFLTYYNHTINPLNGSSMWPEVTYMKPLPPKKKRLPGRPIIKRKTDQSERESQGKTRHTISKAGAVMRCTICRETSHNRSTCPTRPKDAASTSLPKKKKANKCKIEKGTMEPVQVDLSHPDPRRKSSGLRRIMEEVVMGSMSLENGFQMGCYDLEKWQQQEDPIQVEAPTQPGDDVQVDEHVQHVDVHVDDHVNDVPAQPVATGKRTRKYSEIITKIGLRRNVLKKEGSIDHHPLVLE
ncbi:unnamed protein product [Lactuca saligna]|uniref:SWIM-type domain-containing protein n=1 Tax=Lactuca saligna TaxID=75948 RepID=A0AA35ZBQ1_LACSI|nr:unnamed protein product [Lactuca saligna]